MIGLFLSFGFSAIREFFNHTFKDDADIGSILGVPFLVAVPMRAVPGSNGGSSNGTNAILNGLNKILHRNGKKAASSTAHFMTASTNSFAFVVFVIIGISGYFLYLYQSMLFYQNTITMQRFISQDPNQLQQVMLASLNPADNKFSRQQYQNNELVPDKNAGMELLSDKMEQRRVELEKRRALLETELEKIKSEIEIKKPTNEPQRDQMLMQNVMPDTTTVQKQSLQPTPTNNVIMPQKNNTLNVAGETAKQIQNNVTVSTVKQKTENEYQEHIVETGETIVSILRNKYNIPTHLIYNESINLIRAANPDLKNLQGLTKGKKIFIPKEVIGFAKQ
jgi:uncharacterized small protein (DUF1192 family)